MNKVLVEVEFFKGNVKCFDVCESVLLLVENGDSIQCNSVDEYDRNRFNMKGRAQLTGKEGGSLLSQKCLNG